jgi:hypothetical protein
MARISVQDVRRAARRNDPTDYRTSAARNRVWGDNRCDGEVPEPPARTASPTKGLTERSLLLAALDRRNPLDTG